MVRLNLGTGAAAAPRVLQLLLNTSSRIIVAECDFYCWRIRAQPHQVSEGNVLVVPVSSYQKSYLSLVRKMIDITSLLSQRLDRDNEMTVALTQLNLRARRCRKVPDRPVHQPMKIKSHSPFSLLYLVYFRFVSTSRRGRHY